MIDDFSHALENSSTALMLSTTDVLPGCHLYDVGVEAVDKEGETLVVVAQKANDPLAQHHERAANPVVMAPRIRGITYNPAGPPGLGEMRPGDAVKALQLPKPLYSIESREVVDEVEDSRDKSVTYSYKGQIKSCRGKRRTIDFVASETLSRGRRLLEREITYTNAHPAITFLTAKPYIEPVATIENVQSVISVLNERTGNYHSTMRTGDGQLFVAVTSNAGEVISFEHRK